MLLHDRLQTELKQQLEEYSRSQRLNWEIDTEHGINPPTTVSSRRADVAILTGSLPQRGYALEIKTANWSGQVLSHQLRDHLIGGFVPIVITSDETEQKAIDAGTRCSLGWVLEFLSATVAAPPRGDEGSFELREDRLVADDPLREFFSH